MEEIYKIPNGDDFLIEVEVLDDDGVEVDLTAFDWVIEHYTTSGTKHTASYMEGELINAYFDDKKAIVQIDEFDWEFTGQVKEEITIYFTNTDFPDGIQRSSSTVSFIDVVIV